MIEPKLYEPTPAELDALLEEAERLRSMRLPPIPLCRPLPNGRCSSDHEDDKPRAPGTHHKAVGKVPKIAGYKNYAQVPVDEMLRADKFRAHWPCNLGIVIPDGVCAIDCDSPEAEEEVISLSNGADKTTACRERRPGRGRVWIFLIPKNVEIFDLRHVGTSGRIDILAPRSVLVTPPSVSWTGFRYPWVPDQAPHQIGFQELPVGLLRLNKQRDTSASNHRRTLDHEAVVPAVSGKVKFFLQNRKELRNLWKGTGKKSGDTSASGYDFGLAIELLKAQVPDEDVVAALAARPGCHKTDPYYLWTTVDNARNYLRSKK